MSNKVLVAGCSVSDYTHVDKVYGEFLCEKLGYDYIHEGAGCGSNWRIWRVIVNHIINGNLTPNDILIVQYTSYERKEIWSAKESISFSGKMSLRDEYKDGGNLIRFKTHSYNWQPNEIERKFLRLYENNFTNEAYEIEVFKTQHLMFQTLLKEYGITPIFFNFIHYDLSVIDLFKDTRFNVNEIKRDPSYFLENDMFHFNLEGHKYVGNKLHEFIKQK